MNTKCLNILRYFGQAIGATMASNVRVHVWILSQSKSRRNDEPKIRFEKNRDFGIATIVYSEKLRKNQKDKTKSAKNQILDP